MGGALTKGTPETVSLVATRSGMSAAGDHALDRWRGVLVEDDAPPAVLRNIRAMAQARIRNPQWARLYCELMGWVGTREQVINALVVQLGVPVEQAREAVQTVMGTSDNPHEIARECRAYLEWYEQSHPALGANTNGNGVKG